MSAEASQESMRAALEEGRRSRATAIVARGAIQEGVFSADLNRITETTQKEYEKKVIIETTREKLLGCANGALAQAIFRGINKGQNPKRRILDHSATIADPLVWNEHRRRTLFVVPPADSELGATITHETSKRGKVKKGFKIVKRPIPLWLIGELPSDDMNAWNYYAMSPRTCNTKVSEVKNTTSTYSDVFDLLHITSPLRLGKQVSEPTALEAEEAFDPTNRWFKLPQTRSSADASLYPTATALGNVEGISDVDMQNYQVASTLLEFAGAYDLEEEWAEKEIQKYFDARKTIEQWDGSTSNTAVHKQFDRFADEYHTYDALLLALGRDVLGYKNWRGNKRFQNLR
jgi:hypothetical protein